MRQRKLRHAVRTTLASMGLGEMQCEIAVKPTRSTSADAARQTSTFYVLVRLNQWKPEVLLKCKFVERHIQLAASRVGGVRVSHVFWRLGSDVRTPYDDIIGQPSNRPPVSTADAAKRFGPMQGLPADMKDETAPAGLTEPGGLDALIPVLEPARPARNVQASPRKLTLGGAADLDGLEVSEHDLDTQAPTVTGDLDTPRAPAQDAKTAWASLDLHDSTPPRTWAETMPCEFPDSKTPAKNDDAVGFVRL